MKRAGSMFSEQDRAAIGRAVAQAESRCTAEIVPVVATASGRYDRAEDMFGLLFAIGSFIIVWVLFQRQDPTAGGWNGLELTLQLPMLVAVLVVGFGLGALLATYFTVLRRLFIPRAMQRDEVLARARAMFCDQRIHHTAAETGILVYVSLFERQAVVLADQLAFEKLGQKKIDSLCDTLVQGLKQGNVTAALQSAIGAIGDALTEVLPHDGDENNQNELPNALIMLD